MRKSLWAILGVVCVLAAALIYLKAAGRPHPSDEEQIRALLAKGESAIEHKDVKGVLSCVARDYTDDAGLTYETLNAELIGRFRVSGDYDVRLKGTSVRVLRRMTLVKTFVFVDLVYDGRERDKLFSGPIELILLKEKSKRWLVIPIRNWKVSNVSGIPSDLEE